MKKALIFALLVLLALPAMPQNRKYRKSMLSAIEEMNKAKDSAGELPVAATFEEISLKYPDQWVPAYHASRILVVNSFTESDPGKKDQLLQRAKKTLDLSLERAPEESEVHVLKALYYIGLMSVDPQTRGQLYYQDVLDAIQKSKSLNPENPRSWYLDGMMTLNMPEFMGGGPEAAKPIFAEAEEKFKSYRQDDPLWPAWGEDLNQVELDKLK